MESAAADNEKVGAGCRLHESWDRGCGVILCMAMTPGDLGEVDVPAAVRDEGS